jgi:hypothetical protein
MPLFDLGNVSAKDRVNGSVEQAYALSKDVLQGYSKTLDMNVRLERDDPPTGVVARFTDSDGTSVVATVKITETGSTSEIAITLTGKVFVGGLKGAFATDAKVQAAAKEKLVDTIKKALKDGGLLGVLQAIGARDRIFTSALVGAARRQGYA